ncbi:MAG: polysaccharide deacetylase family protein [Terriglobales bacterium]|jgi:peptidoglycan/xylan/chitin deacetylase (PgdA/CDA1 family)
MEPEIVYLMYHELEIPGRLLCQTEPGYVRYIVAAADFRAQMQSLKDANRQGVSVSEALTFPAKPSVTITFDDGSETDLLVAAPILKEFGFGATFYVTSGFVGTQGYLSAQQLRELNATGFEIGCHSKTHPYLPDLDDSRLREEVAGAKAELEQILGRPVEHFSCPGGRYDPRVRKVASEAGYRSVATSRIHANSKSTDVFALGRVAMMRGTDLRTFAALCQGRGLWQLALRDRLRRGAKRVLGNSFYDRVRATALRNGVAQTHEKS